MKALTKEKAIEMLEQIDAYIDDAVEMGEDVSEIVNYIRGVAEDNWMFI
jgi:hypothetical protein